MLELIVNYLNQSLAVLGYWERITCLAEIKEDEKGNRQPIAYIGQGQWSAIDFDNADGWGYFRLRGEITSSDVVGVATLRKRVTKSFPLRFVFAVRRSKLSADDAFAFARIAQTVEAAITNDYGPLVAQIGAARVTVRVTSQNGDALAVWTDETAGTGTLEPRYELVYGAIDIEVSVTADIACFALECDDVDLDLLHTFDFCLPTVRERLTETQVECLIDAYCEPITPCDPLTITFNGETITTIDEPCGETVALTCSTLTASAYVEDGNPVTGAYHPDGTLNGKTKYTKDATHYLFYNGSAWELEKQGANETATAGNENFPWLATWPTITVTQANIGEACCECASGEVVVTNSEGDPIATIDVPSGVTVPYEIPDVDWTDSDGSAQSTPYGDAIVCTPCTAPSLAVSTSNATPAYGSSVTLTATATGFTPTIYTWYANGVEIGTGSSLAWTVNRPGSISIICVATDGTLTAQNSVSLTVSLALNSVWYGDGVNDGFAVTYRPVADTDKLTMRVRFLSEATGSSWPISIINNASGGELIRVNINTTQIITYVWTGTGFLVGTANYNAGVYNELLVTRCTGSLVGANNTTRIYLNGVLVNSAINTSSQAVGITGYFGQTIYGNTKMKVKCLSFFSGGADNTSATQLAAQADTDFPAATGLTLEEHFVFSDAPFVPSTTGKLSRIEGIMGNGNIWFNQGHASPYGLVAP